MQETKTGRQQRPATRGGGDREGGRGGRGGGDRGGRGGDRGGRGGARGSGRPRTAYKTDVEGNQSVQYDKRRERKPYQGEVKEGGERRYDRKDGTGAGKRGDKKGGHGRANWGRDGEYRQKGEPKEEKEAKPEEEKKEKEEEEVKYIEEIIGVSMEDYFKERVVTQKKAPGREAQKISAKVEEKKEGKEKQSTTVQNTYLKGTVAKTTTANAGLLGIKADDDTDARPARGGERGGDAGAQRGGRRQNPKHALKKTEEDFPTL